MNFKDSPAEAAFRAEVREFVEFEPAGVLVGLVKRTLPEARALKLSDLVAAGEPTEAAGETLDAATRRFEGLELQLRMRDGVPVDALDGDELPIPQRA